MGVAKFLQPPGGVENCLGVQAKFQANCFIQVQLHHTQPVLRKHELAEAIAYRVILEHVRHVVPIDERIIHGHNFNVVTGKCGTQYQPANASKACRPAALVGNLNRPGRPESNEESQASAARGWVLCQGREGHLRLT